MGVSEYVAIAVFFLGIIVAIVGWLLSNKDKKQQDEIKDLWKAVSTLQNENRELELKLAGNYHSKDDITKLFGDFQRWMEDKFRHLDQQIERAFTKEK